MYILVPVEEPPDFQRVPIAIELDIVENGFDEVFLQSSVPVVGAMIHEGIGGHESNRATKYLKYTLCVVHREIHVRRYQYIHSDSE